MDRIVQFLSVLESPFPNLFLSATDNDADFRLIRRRRKMQISVFHAMAANHGNRRPVSDASDRATRPGRARTRTAVHLGLPSQNATLARTHLYTSVACRREIHRELSVIAERDFLHIDKWLVSNGAISCRFALSDAAHKIPFSRGRH